MKEFNNTYEALSYLFNDKWDDLEIEFKRKFKHSRNNFLFRKSITLDKAEEILNFFAKIEKKITFFE